jgi:hypothetical protein
VRETLSPLPNAASGPPAVKPEYSLPYFTPTPHRLKLRPHHITIASSRDKTVAEASQRTTLVKKNMKKMEKQPVQSSPTVPGVMPLSNEPPVWDVNGLELTSTTKTRELWSTLAQLSVSIASPLSNISSMEHHPGTIMSGASGDPLSAVLTTDSQNTWGSIITSNTGETMCPVLSAPLPPQQPASEQSTTNRSAAPPIGGHSGSSHLNPVPQFNSTQALPRSKLHARRYYNLPQLSGTMDGLGATTNASTSQRTTYTQSTSSSVTSSTIVQPASTPPPSPAHSSSDSGIGGLPPPTTPPKVEPSNEETQQRWNNRISLLTARA